MKTKKLVKKALTIFLISTTILLIFAGCINKNKTEKEKISITFKAIDLSENTIANIELSFSSNDKLLETLKKDVEFIEKNGNVTSISGVSSADDEDLKWVYTINGMPSSKSLIEADLNDGDIIEFRLTGKPIEKHLVFKALKLDESEIVSMEIDFLNTASIIEKLEADADLIMEDGLVISIAGVKHDPDKNIYWSFTVNNEWAEKGLSDMEFNDGDNVVFTLKDFSESDD